ncbi:DMT family transporter [Desulfonema magnum]|uniref:EamA domain-containing protein n=1 Tax=Desulfonema magnum TaxID=45655 RepID=A0A975GNU3_9BACT|nr:DMT family transporter [Desulfonema magnum]QTA88140.1 EamA domain-containing protein [Desulfonema magnum]
MLWFILSLLAALAVSSQDAWMKKFFSHLSPYEMAMCPLFYSMPLFAIAVLFVPVPRLDSIFFWSFLISIPLNGVAFVLYMKAIKVSPLSLTVPYLAFTPGFMIVTGYVFLDEMPNTWGILGILIICAGCYILNIEPGRRSFLAPFKAILKETGSWLMFILSFLFSFAAVIGKKAILHSSPLFFTLSFFAVFNLVLFLFLLLFRKVRIRTFREEFVKGVIAGGIFFLHALLHGLAISLTKAAYMISVKRLSVVFGVIYGKLLFKEANIGFRFSGALLMLAGTILITLQGL